MEQWADGETREKLQKKKKTTSKTHKMLVKSTVSKIYLIWQLQQKHFFTKQLLSQQYYSINSNEVSMFRKIYIKKRKESDGYI